MSADGKWTFNTLNNDLWQNGDFNTKKEAEEAATNYAKYYDLKKMAIGQIQLIPLRTDVEIESVLDNLDELHADDCGPDYSGYLYDSVSDEGRKWLEEKMAALIEEFHQREKIEPDWYSIYNEYEIDIEED